jgi:Putative transposase/Transposase zinc-binding domain
VSQPPPAFAGAGYCPKCQGAAATDWLAAREADLLPVGYFHVVFTLPAEIAPIAYQNKAVVYDLLFRTAAETLLTIAADPKHLGARIGATAVLHSWGSAMTHHPHVHMIVPGGGISLDGTHWVRCKPGFLLPVRVLSRLFRRLFLEALADAHAAGRLGVGDLNSLRYPPAFAAHLVPLKRKNWLRQAALRRADQALSGAGKARSAVISGFQLSPISAKPSSANAAARPNPHRRPTARRSPAGSFFGGFRTPAPIPRPLLAPGRHPKPYPKEDIRFIWTFGPSN